MLSAIALSHLCSVRGPVAANGRATAGTRFLCGELATVCRQSARGALVSVQPTRRFRRKLSVVALEMFDDAVDQAAQREHGQRERANTPDENGGHVCLSPSE